MSPFLVKSKTENPIPVPCGKCPACAARRTSAWSFRLLQEDKHAESSHFITLTYDTQHAPISQNGFMALDKRDLQLFFKRLRKAHSKGVQHGRPQTIGQQRSPGQAKQHVSLKYYAVGEYGGKSYRPHYHIILFNAKVELIQDAWGLGHVHYGDVNGASVGYTLKYISKPKRIPLHRNDDRQPEFSLMSKGLGSSYCKAQTIFVGQTVIHDGEECIEIVKIKKGYGNMVDWHKSSLENRMYCTLPDGKKLAMPRYYKDRIYTTQERARAGFFTRIESLKRQAEAEASDPNYQVNKDKAILAAFEKQKKNATKLDKL
ncbi:MAG: replication initiator protein [Microviridae sp.]|nr:MAG: replication initiator protein [Microviridae sp.]